MYYRTITVNATVVNAPIRAEGTTTNRLLKTKAVIGVPLYSKWSVELITAYFRPNALAQSMDAPIGKAFSHVDVDAIPFAEVSNDSGTTVIIGD